MAAAAARNQGRNGAKTVNLPMKPTDVPKTTKIVGPRQHEVARSDAIIVPRLEIFSFFMAFSVAYDRVMPLYSILFNLSIVVSGR